MRIGDIVALKGYDRLTGEVKAIDDFDRATVKLTKSGAEILAHICDLDVVAHILDIDD